jgi:mannan endo-1,4-beta-mannosidase
MLKPAILLILTLSLVSAWDPLVGTNPSSEVQALFNYLSNNNRKSILSGQTNNYYKELKAKVGKSPLVQGFDMQNYSPHNPWYNWQPYDDGTVQNAIDWHRSTNGKGIVTFHWHWFSPMGGQLRTSTFYTNYTDFDVTKAVVANTAEYNATIRDIDAIAVQLKRLQAAKVPVLWRPLHEAGGKWFWWGAKTSTACKQLLEIIFQRINTHHAINNLIWVWSTPESDWYPGKNRVDILGYDSYPGSYNYDCNIKMFMQLHGIVGGSKILTLSENGPIPDIGSCFSSGAMWSFFMSWADLVVQQNDDNHLRAVYADSRVKTVENA